MYTPSSTAFLRPTRGGGFGYVEYDNNAFPYPQTIGSTAPSITGLGPADESMIDTIFIMPNKSTNPDATLMIVVDEVDPPTDPKTYQYVYVGNINDLPSDILTESSIVDIPGTGLKSVMSQKSVTDLTSEYNVSTNNNNTEYTFAQAVVLVPASLQKGGLTIKYIDSTTHEYVIKRLMSSTWNTTESNWQGIDEEPTADSNNLVKSGGVVKHLADNIGYTADPESWTLIGNCSISNSGNWDVGNTFESKSFDVTKLRSSKLVVTANNIGAAIISFVKSINYPQPPVFATGETGRHVIPASTFKTLIVPTDAVYAVVTTKNDNQDRTPLIYSEFAKFQEIEHSVNTFSDSLYRTITHTVIGKGINDNGVFFNSADFKIVYFSTESDNFTISLTNISATRTIRIHAFKNGVWLGQLFTSTPSSTTDISINFPHYGVVFAVSWYKDNTFAVSNLVTEDGVCESVRKLLVNSKNQTYLIDTYLNKGRMEYVAHRGLRTVAPENSIPAYEAAGKAGFDFLNLAQLRQSADGTWYVMHDDTIDRTTDGTGQIKNLTDAYLQTVHIDVGPNVEQYTPEELVIPTLEKAIQIARKYGMKLYFRIASITGNSYQADKSAWDSFIVIIRKYRCEGMLFGGNALTDLLPLHRDLGLDWCINYDVYSQAAVTQQINDYIAAGIKNATIFPASINYLTDEHIALARANGYKIMVGVADSTTKEQCLALSNRGVDIISGVVKYDLGSD